VKIGEKIGVLASKEERKCHDLSAVLDSDVLAVRSPGCYISWPLLPAVRSTRLIVSRSRSVRTWRTDDVTVSVSMHCRCWFRGFLPIAIAVTKLIDNINRVSPRDLIARLQLLQSSITPGKSHGCPCYTILLGLDRQHPEATAGRTAGPQLFNRFI